MAREVWEDLEAERLQRLRDRDRERDDFGQVDYSDAYRYDPHARAGYRTFDGGRAPDRVLRDERYRDVDYGRPPRRARRDGPSDRVLWAVIMERLDDERRLDLSDVEVSVYDAEVTLDGTIRHKADKRRIEDVADIDGVRHVQNNLRVRESRRWTFF